MYEQFENVNEITNSNFLPLLLITLYILRQSDNFDTLSHISQYLSKTVGYQKHYDFLIFYLSPVNRNNLLRWWVTWCDQQMFMEATKLIWNCVCVCVLFQLTRIPNPPVFIVIPTQNHNNQLTMFELFTILTSPTVSSDSEALGSVCVNCPFVCGCGTEVSTI